MTKIKPFRKIEGTRAPFQLYEYSNDEKVEYARCYHSVEYFIENYVKYKGATIKLHEFQKSIIQHHLGYKFTVELFSRQTGVDAIMSAVYLWHMMFHGKSIFHVSINGTDMIYDKIFNMYKTVPTFLQAGLNTIERGKKMRFENGGHIRFFTYSKTLAIGSNYNIFVLDNAALTRHFREVMINLIPMVNSLKNTSITVRSTPNAFNYFYELVNGAERKEGDPKKNLFKCNRVYWWEVPGRDAAWREEMIKLLGSEEAFDREYDLQFYDTSKR